MPNQHSNSVNAGDCAPVAKRVRRQRFRNARPGSVLILVVALIVLLALIGTALISTTRNDRYASVQNIANTQVDLLVQGVLNMVKGTVIDDVFGTAPSAPTIKVYRPPTTIADIYNYEHFESPLTSYDTWIASRIPEKDASNNAIWRYISGPLTGGQFDNLYGTGTPTYTNRAQMQPDAVTVNYSDGTTRIFPGWLLPGNIRVIAADTDGDGIADASLVRFPVGQIDGVTYYYAVRLVDNNAAVNVNTGNSQAFDFNGIGDHTDAIGTAQAAGSSAGNLGWLRSHVGLNEMLSTYTVPGGVNGTGSTEADAFNLYRFQSATLRTGVVAATPASNPVDDNGVARTDFKFLTQGDALEMMLARRLRNPGANASMATTDRYQALSVSESARLASKFILVDSAIAANPSTARSRIEQIFSPSLTGSAYNVAPTFPTKAYAANNANTATTGWFPYNFDYDAGFKTLRPLLVTSNPLSNLAPIHANLPTSAAVATAMGAYPAATPKASLNTAAFGELWRAYWNVMTDNAINPADANGFNTPFGITAPPATLYYGNHFAAATPFAATAELHPQKMFRSSLREPTPGVGTTYFDPANQLLLRSAIAAMNTIAMRDSSRPTIVPKTDITLQATVNGTATPVTVSIYGAKPQLFLTEVYVSTDTKSVPSVAAGALPNPSGYMALEFYNPTNVPIPLKNWKLACLTRSAFPAMTLPVMPTAPTADFSNATDVSPVDQVIQPGEYLLVENYLESGTGTAKHRPQSSGLPTTGVIPPRGALPVVNKVYVARLNEMVGTEIVLFRPLDPAAPAASVSSTDYAPVDSFDGSGFTVGTPTSAHVWHYARANDPTGATTAWRMVYPGRYDGGATTHHQQGTDESAVFDPTLPDMDPWIAGVPGPGVSLGATGGGLTPPAATNANGGSTYPSADTFTVQFANSDSPEPKAVTGATPFTFPFGGFARNGDVLQVPFIGAYQVRNVANIVEINPVTIDSAFAEDTDTADNATEQIGRFCPIGNPIAAAPGRGDYEPTDPANPGGNAAIIAAYRYQWATDVMDYLTAIQAPSDDYFPNVPNPTTYATVTSQTAPVAVPNGPISVVASANAGNENSVGVEGLVNINTASWKVLSTLPFVPYVTGNTNNIALAKAIVLWRDGDGGANVANGPFKSLFDLYKVPAFSAAQTAVLTAEPDDGMGDFSPLGATVLDGARSDFEEKFLFMTRLSNLLTTRSDSFTCYVLVQGWRGVGTTTPTLEVERRAALIIDRSAVSAVNKDVSSTVVPQD